MREVVGSFVNEADGVEHIVERVTDPARLESIAAAVASTPVLIADGHHRYAISRTYRDERRAADGDNGSAELTLTYVSELVAEQLKMPPMSDRALPPVLVLVSDGQPTDDFNAGVKAMMDQPWGAKAVRVAIAIGDDADLDVLQKFIGHPERKPIQVTNANDLVKMIKNFRPSCTRGRMTSSKISSSSVRPWRGSHISTMPVRFSRVIR